MHRDYGRVALASDVYSAVTSSLTGKFHTWCRRCFHYELWYGFEVAELLRDTDQRVRYASCLRYDITGHAAASLYGQRQWWNFTICQVYMIWRFSRDWYLILMDSRFRLHISRYEILYKYQSSISLPCLLYMRRPLSRWLQPLIRGNLQCQCSNRSYHLMISEFRRLK